MEATQQPPVSQHVEGDHNMQVGGDLHIHQIYSEDAETVSVRLDAYSGAEYLPPQCAGTILQLVHAHQFVILHGKTDVHLPDLCRHVAAQLVNKGLQHAVLQWRREPGDGKSLQEALRQLKSPTILLVDGLFPLEILDDPIGVRDIAQGLGHVVLASTAVPQSKWGLPAGVFQQIWFEMPTTQLYDEQLLLSYLLKRLDQENLDLDPAWLAGQRSQDWQAAVHQLGTPPRIARLIHLLRTLQGTITRERFQDVLKDAASTQDQFIAAWYHRANDQEKLILLAAILFQGLDEQQFFELLDSLIDQRWQYRSSKLKALDYCDLEAIKDFVDFQEVGEDAAILTPRVVAQELSVLRSAIPGYRRHVLAAVPVMMRAMLGSIGNGLHRPSMRLRRELGLSVGRLALILPTAVLPELRSLADHRSLTARRVAAKSLSAWREFGFLDRMFEVVDQWLSTDNSVAVRYTALMTLAYAADSDVPNQLNPGILERVKRSMSDRSDGVRQFIKDLIPRLLRNHPLQVGPVMLEEVLRERGVYRKRDHIEPIAKGLAWAVNDYPVLMSRYLHDQLRAALGSRSETGLGSHTSHRDRKLITVLETFLHVDYARVGQYVDPESLLRLLAAERPKETQPTVRAGVMAVILHLMKTAGTLDKNVWEMLLADSIFSERVQLILALGDLIANGQIQSAAPYLERIVTDLGSSDYASRFELLKALSLFWPKHHAALPDECIHYIGIFLQHFPNSDRIYFIHIIGELYLDNRAALPLGDFTAEVAGRTIPVYVGNRPLTAIERQMTEWVGGGNRILRKTGLLCWMEFARRFDMEERRLIANWVPTSGGGFGSNATDMNGNPAEASGQLEDGLLDYDDGNGGTSAASSNSVPLNAPQRQAYTQITRIPLSLRIIGCLCVLFAPQAERQRFWQAVHAILARPRELGTDSLQHGLGRLLNSHQPVPRELATRIRRLRQWTTTFNIRM